CTHQNGDTATGICTAFLLYDVSQPLRLQLAQLLAVGVLCSYQRMHLYTFPSQAVACGDEFAVADSAPRYAVMDREHVFKRLVDPVDNDRARAIVAHELQSLQQQVADAEFGDLQE